MKLFMSGALEVPYPEMLALRQAGKLNMGIDEAVAARILETKVLHTGLDTTAFRFWSIVGVLVFLASIAASFYYAWWWFIVGLIAAIVLNKGNRKSAAQSVLAAAEQNAECYEKLRSLQVLQYQMSEVDAQPFERPA